MRRTDSIYNSKELVVDPELTFLSYNQTINAEFTVEEILDSPLWSVNSDNGLIKAIPLFNCDKITSSNKTIEALIKSIYHKGIREERSELANLHVFYTSQAVQRIILIEDSASKGISDIKDQLIQQNG